MASQQQQGGARNVVRRMFSRRLHNQNIQGELNSTLLVEIALLCLVTRPGQCYATRVFPQQTAAAVSINRDCSKGGHFCSCGCLNGMDISSSMAREAGTSVVAKFGVQRRAPPALRCCSSERCKTTLSPAALTTTLPPTNTNPNTDRHSYHRLVLGASQPHHNCRPQHQPLFDSQQRSSGALSLALAARASSLVLTTATAHNTAAKSC